MDKEKRKKIHDLVDQIIDLVESEQVFASKDVNDVVDEFEKLINVPRDVSICK